jgi:hypothetical protein
MSTITKVSNRFLVFIVFTFTCVRGVLTQQIHSRVNDANLASSDNAPSTGGQVASSRPVTHAQLNLQGITARPLSSSAAQIARAGSEPLPDMECQQCNGDGCDDCDDCDDCDGGGDC